VLVAERAWRNGDAADYLAERAM